jgi:hypothetical protein
MKPNLPVTRLLLITLVLSASISRVAAQTWTLTSAPGNYWGSVASSADGRMLVAVAFGDLNNKPGPIYRSANAGTNWTLTSAPAKYWRSVASSADGTKLVAAADFADAQANPGRLYTSLNSGTYWIETSAPAGFWFAVAASADGNEMIAAPFYGGIYISTNSGFTWTQTTAPTNYWQSIASSADGAKLVAVCDYDPNTNPGQIYISTNSGVTWTATSAPMTLWQSVASSADGTKLVAGDGTYYTGPIYTSSDSGMTWAEVFGPYDSAPLVASSADGVTLVAAGADNGGISISLDSGTTWTQTSAPEETWYSVASSADGSKLVAVSSAGGIYTLQAAAPLILLQPASQTVVAGSTVTLNVGIFGSHPLTYQWTSNSVSLLDVTNAAFVLTNVTLSDSATYAVLVTNSLGHVASSNAVLTVVPALVTTLNAEVTAATSAVLHGAVTAPDGTAAWFDWGTDTNYGNLTDITNLPTGNSSTFVSIALNGLSPGVFYHYRLTASNAFGIAHGDDQAFLAGISPIANILLATGITMTSATLNATVDPGGWDTAAYFLWGTDLYQLTNSTPAVDLGSGTTSVNFSNLVSNLSPSTFYYCYVIASNALGAAINGYIRFLTGPWTMTTAPPNYWASIAASADGTKLVALSFNPGSIYTSTNSGGIWTSASAPTNYWQSVAFSADGIKLVAAAYQDLNFNPGSIYTSTNSGATWTPASAPTNHWQSVASSADGTKLVAATYQDLNFNPGLIYASTNNGMTWMPGGAPSNYWQSVASSADGTKLVAAAHQDLNFNPGLIYASTNNGMTWMPGGAPSNYWQSVASSANGTKLVAAAYKDLDFNPGLIYTSTNSGATWKPSGAPSNYWNSVASSADGTKLIAAADDGIYASTNGGATWETSLAGVWANLALSADGNKTFAAAGNMGIFALQSTPSPVLGIQPSGGNAVISWIVPSMDFVLQRNSDLATTNWTGVLPPPTLNLTNLKNEVTLPPPTGNGFFRLLHP